MNNTKPFFIVSSGRSGTKMIEKLLSSFPEVEMHHEYLCEYIQPLSVKYYLGLLSNSDIINELKKLHGASIHYSKKSLWGDSSNKLSWLISPLDTLFPNAKFIHLIRDGRKVVSSFYNKLRDECYDDISTRVLQSWVDNPAEYLEPPPEKKYWWNVAKMNSTIRKKFVKYNQFQRICFHWNEVNNNIEKELNNIINTRKMIIRLEDLVTDEMVVQKMISFLELEYHEDIFKTLKKPHNVNIPIDYQLTKKQKDQFYEIAGKLMGKYGYRKKGEYKVEYNGDKPIKYNRK